MELSLSFALLMLSAVANCTGTATYTIQQSTTNPVEEVSLRFVRDVTSGGNETDSVPGNVNITVDHRYYTSRYQNAASHLFVDVAQMNDTAGARHNVFLSSRHNHGMVERLNFLFPFYGHLVRSIVVATGGFLFVGPALHRFVTETNYIAPLMANFNPNISSESKIYIYSTSSVFIAQWDHVAIDDQRTSGNFTFQTRLYPNGSIVFAYKDVPVAPSSLSSVNHPVRIGLSNAYIRNVSLGTLEFRAIVRYHTIALPREDVRSGAGFEITALPTCVQASSCAQCTGPGIDFQCRWCDKLRLCSDNFDWFNQQWFDSGCFNDARNSCTVATAAPSTTGRTVTTVTLGPGGLGGQTRDGDDGLSGAAEGAIVAFCLILILVVLVTGFIFWAYLHPTTPSGLLLIKYNPTKWFHKDKSEA